MPEPNAAILDQQKAPHVDVRPMSIHTGAEIHGVDLRQPLSAAEVTAIRNALLRWKVIFFRDQDMDHAQHVDFARQFGDPTPGHVVFGHDSEIPEIYSVAKYRASNRNITQDAHRLWTGWHTDVTAAINPPWASILRGVVVPPYGGDTYWTNLVVAFEKLSPTLQSWLTTLSGVHRYDLPSESGNVKEYDDVVAANVLESEHPLVRVHPETGEKVLYCSPFFLRSIVGLLPVESDALLHMLWEHAVRSDWTVRFRWEPGSVAFWDNRSTAHLAPRDIFDADFDRQFYRVTLNGDVPVDVNSKPSRSISGKPIQAV